MATRAPSSGGGAQAGRHAQPTTAEKLAEVERFLLAKKPWPAFLLVGSDALGEWENCPVVVKDALEWMATSAIGMIDIASVGPLIPICRAFKAIVEAAGGAAESENKLAELISWCAFIIGVFIKLGKAADADALSDIRVCKCMQAFETTANRLAKRSNTLATRHKSLSLLFHRKDSADIASFDAKLRTIWADLGVLATLEARGVQRRLLPPSLEPMAPVPIGALSLPGSHVERTCMVEEIVSALTTSGAGRRPHMLLGMGGGGKTVLASSVVRHEDIRKHFRQGIFWITVGQGGNNQLHALLQGLAREVGAAPTDTPHGTPSDGFNSLSAVVQHLTAVGTRSLPRLVVLDDVWERTVVDTVLPTGFVLLVTTRDESVVGVPGRTRTDVGDMTEEEAVMLVRRASGSVGSPGQDIQAAVKQVARDCGLLPLALAIAGSMPVANNRGSSVQAWKQLHEDLQHKEDLLLADDGTNKTLYRVLDASFGKLGARQKTVFLKMAVIPKGAVAPEDMLLNLWEVEDVLETRDEAQGLMSRSLLQAVDGEGYRMHDLLLDFARDRVKPAMLELSTKCQARYLSRLDVVRGYADESSTTTGFYTLMVLWRSAEELSDNPLLQVEAYRASLHVLAAEESSDAVYIHWTLGNLFALQGKYAEAEPLYLRAIAVAETVLGTGHLSTAAALDSLAQLFQAQGKYARAEPLFQRTLDIKEKTLGPNHPSTARTLCGLADLFREQGNNTEAGPLYLRAVDIGEKTLGPDHHEVARTFNSLALMYETQAKYGEAEALYVRSIGIYERTVGPGHRFTAVSLSNLAGALQAQSKYAEAEAIYLRAIDIKEKALGPDHHEVAITLNHLAYLFGAWGKHNKAIPLLERALKIRIHTLGAWHKDTDNTQHALELARKKVEQAK